MTSSFELLRKRLSDARKEMTPGSSAATQLDPLVVRLKDLANRNIDHQERRAVGDLVTVRRADFTFATAVESTREVRTVEVAALPSSGEIINGIFQIRGRTCCLVDLAPFFGDSTPLKHGDKTSVLVVSGPEGDLGLRIDEILGTRSIFEDDLDTGLTERAIPFVSLVTRDLLHVIDVGALMASPEVRI